MKKLHQNSLSTLLMVFTLAQPKLASAYDSGSMALGNILGAVDYYKISCSAGDTDHLNFKVKDTTPSDQPVIAPQLINAHITKDSLSQNALNMKPGDAPAELTLQGGNGKYMIVMDTVGTNLSLTNLQTYKMEYQCLSADNLILKSYTSTIKKLKNSKTAKNVATCAAKKKTKTTPLINTDRLQLTLTNTTPPPSVQTSQLLNAQVINGNKVITIADTLGDAFYSNDVNLKGVSGDYFIMVNHTGSDATKNNAKLYEFQASCLNANNTDTGAPTVQLLQDQ